MFLISAIASDVIIQHTNHETGFENSSDELIAKLNTEIAEAKRLLEDGFNPFRKLLANNPKKWRVYNLVIQ